LTELLKIAYRWGRDNGSNRSDKNFNDLLQTEAINQALRIHDAISWVAVSEKLPTVEDNGQKVLIYRIMNDSQSSLAVSIYETNMVKYCNPNETWWRELPETPCT